MPYVAAHNAVMAPNKMCPVLLSRVVWLKAVSTDAKAAGGMTFARYNISSRLARALVLANRLNIPDNRINAGNMAKRK